MSTPTMPRTEWLALLKSQIQPVGECMEWQGAYVRTVPVVYTPKGYAWDCPYAGRHSVRSVLFCLANGRRLPKGSLIRPGCWNDKCVDERHFKVLTRKEQSAEQVKRGELVTAKFVGARIRVARERSPLTSEQVRDIRASLIPARAEAKTYGVSSSTINAIRRGERWNDHFPGASIFSLGQALANFKG